MISGSKILSKGVKIGLGLLGHHFTLERREGPNMVQIFMEPSPSREHDTHMRFIVTTTVTQDGVALERRFDCGFIPEAITIIDSNVIYGEVGSNGEVWTRSRPCYGLSLAEHLPDLMPVAIGRAKGRSPIVIGGLRWVLGPSKEWFQQNINGPQSEEDRFYFFTGDRQFPFGNEIPQRYRPMEERMCFLCKSGEVVFGTYYDASDVYDTFYGLWQELVAIRNSDPEFFIF